MPNVFITGASGSLGSALVPKLVTAGYHVTALSRSASSSTKIQALAPGVETIRGDSTDLDICSNAAAGADIVIHLAFDHGKGPAFSGDYAGACEKDLAVTRALLDGLTRDDHFQGKTFMIASSVLGLDGQDEKSQPMRNPMFPRYKAWDLAESYASKGLGVVVLRLSPVTWSTERPHAFINMHLAAAKQSGQLIHADSHVWPACSYSDAAHGIVLAAQARDKLETPVNLHFVAELVSHKDVALALGQVTGKEARQVEEDELASLGPFKRLMQMAKPVATDRTKAATGWQPKEGGFIEQIGRWKYD